MYAFLARTSGHRRRSSYRVVVVNEPPEFRSLLVGLPDEASFDVTLDDRPDIVVAFHTSAADRESSLGHLADAVFPDRTVWLAWPNKTSGVETDLTGDVVRGAIHGTTLVDVKVCAISDTWSGLKAAWRKGHR